MKTIDMDGIAVTAFLSGKRKWHDKANEEKFVAACQLISANFTHETNELVKQSELYRVRFFELKNPHSLNHFHQRTSKDYMRVCIKALMDCDRVYLMDDWRGCKYSRMEVMIAAAMHIEIYSLESNEPYKLSFLQRVILFIKHLI